MIITKYCKVDGKEYINYNSVKERKKKPKTIVLTDFVEIKEKEKDEK